MSVVKEEKEEERNNKKCINTKDRFFSFLSLSLLCFCSIVNIKLNTHRIRKKS